MVAEDWGGIGREIHDKYYGVSKDTFKIRAISGKPLGTGLSQARTPLSEYSEKELFDHINGGMNFRIMTIGQYEKLVIQAGEHVKCLAGQKNVRWQEKCYRPCCASKPEPIDWSSSWNEDVDDHPRR